MAEVVWTARALRDLEAIVEESTAEYSAARAAKMAARIAKALAILEWSPLIGPVVHEFRREHIRERYAKPFRVLYIVRDDTCNVAMIVHANRDLSSIDPDDLENLAPN